MIGFPSGVRIYLALEPHDMRKSFNGLAAIASDIVERGLENGSLFVFTNKPRNRLKILYYDRTGVCVLAKRLEKGTFSWPPPSKAGAAAVSLAPEALHLLFDGIDLRGAEMRPLSHIPGKIEQKLYSEGDCRNGKGDSGGAGWHCMFPGK